MLFGLTNALGTFQRMMDDVFEELSLEAGRNYINDIIIGLETFEEHLEALEKVFQQLEKAGLKIKPQKCQFTKK
jgi:hypothetical protein